MDTICRNANLFRHIYDIKFDERTSEVGGILLDRCHSLVTIEAVVDGKDSQNSCRYWEEMLWPLIERNKVSLQRLQFHVLHHSFMNTKQLPSLVACLPHLRSLGLEGQEMSVQDLLPILDACPRSLEWLNLRLDLPRMRSNRQGPIPHPHHSLINTTATSLQLKHLHIHGTFGDRTLEDILSCLVAHSLEELHITVKYPLRASSILQDALWQLTYLHLKATHPGPGKVVRVLDSIQPHHLRHVNLNSLDTGWVHYTVDRAATWKPRVSESGFTSRSYRSLGRYSGDMSQTQGFDLHSQAICGHSKVD